MKLETATSPKKISMKIISKRLNEACVKENFQLELSYRFSPLQVLEAKTQEERCQDIKKCISSKFKTGCRIQTEAVQAMDDG